MTKALIAVTSYDGVFYADGTKTGLFYTEALHPFEVFEQNGIEVDFASETGTFGIDEHSLHEMFLNGKDLDTYNDKNSSFNQKLNQIKKASDINPDDYDVIYASAGHATLFDYPTATDLIRITESIYARGGIIAAVCHGPALFGAIKDKNGDSLLKGKRMTGFTDIGETELDLDEIIANAKVETVEQAAKRIGAIYIAPKGPWDDFTVTDGRILSGVNPQSARSLAERVVEEINN